MKKIALTILLLAQLSACSQTHVDIKSAPPHVTRVQTELDDLECANESRYHGPWIFQPFFYYSSEEKHRNCLIRRGYTVGD